MQWGKRGPGSPSRRRETGVYRPNSESLETRRLMSAAPIDLSTIQTQPQGVVYVGKASGNHAGYTVTDVGNVTGSGYDSFVISAPGFGPPAVLGGLPSITGGTGSAAYLVFGSKQVNINTIADYLTLTKGTTNGTTSDLIAGKRASDLGELGTLGVQAQSGTTNPPVAQTNPTVFQPLPYLDTSHTYGFNFDGVTLVTGLNTATGLGRNSALGYSVSPLGDLNADGFDDFAISAPNDAGGGKVFVIYGGNQLTALTSSTAGKTIDLEPVAGTTSTLTPTKVISLSITGGTAGEDVGFSVAGIGNYFNTTTGRDLAIGVPGMTVGTNANAGAVFAVSGTYLNSLSTGTNVDLAGLGNGTNTVGGIEYTGTAANAYTGFSVATPGSFDGQTGSGKPLDDLLIGAPGYGFGGQAYLVYANQTYPLINKVLGSTVPLTTLGVPPVTIPAQTFPLQGVVFTAQDAGSLLGYSVSSAGDFNADGVNDIALGAPGYSSPSAAGAGYVYIVYGQAGTATGNNLRLNGIFPITPTAQSGTVKATSFIGQLGDEAGYALATTTHIQIGASTTTQPAYDMIIGAPGLQRVYLVPGTPAGTAALGINQSLSNINTTLNGNLFNFTGTADPAIQNQAGGFGTSVSARNPIFDANTRPTTVDGDSVPDLFFGAPNASLDNLQTPSTVGARPFSGVAYVVEGSLIGGTTGTGTTPTTTTGSAAVSLNTILTSLAPVIFTGDNYGLPSPPLSSLTHLDSYAPLPVQLAFQQFRPKPGYVTREVVALHPNQRGGAHNVPAGTVLNVAAIGHSENTYSLHPTLRHHVFDRGKTKVGRVTKFTHHVKVIPANLQTETYPG